MHVLFGDKRAVVFFFILCISQRYIVYFWGAFYRVIGMSMFFLFVLFTTVFFPAFSVIFLVNIVFSECCSAFLLTVFCANDS